MDNSKLQRPADSLEAAYDGTIASVTPNVCRLFGLANPALADEPVTTAVTQFAADILGTAPIERCLIYCPDALGDQLWSKFPDHARRVTGCAPCQIHVSSVVPPVTPVCFASVFAGALPARHGIRKYVRPVLSCDTLFDALLRTGRRIAIVAVKNSSVDLIFRGRQMDYFSEEYDPEVTQRALTILAANRHELVVVYHQQYDDLLHKTHPHSGECLAALAHHIDSFETLCRAVQAQWSAHRRAVVFAPDHGAHIDPATGRGNHCLDIPEDMSLRHWYGVWPASEAR